MHRQMIPIGRHEFAFCSRIFAIGQSGYVHFKMKYDLTKFLAYFKHLLTISALSIILMLAACGDPGTDNQTDTADQRPAVDFAQTGGIYRAPLMETPTTLDPAYVRDWYGETIVHQVFDGLVQFGPYLSVLPALAESWQVHDGGRTIRFILRPDARFHNGREVTAEDAKFSLTRLLRITPSPAILPHLLKIEGAPEFRNGESEQIGGLKSPDPRELHIALTEPHAPFLTALAMYQASIVPQEELDRGQPLFGKAPVGTGPFSFVDWQENRWIRLKRYEHYFAGRAFLEEIRFRIFPGVQIDEVLTEFKAAKLEEMPFYFGIRKELSENTAYQRFHRPSLSLLFYGMNTRHPLLKHPDVRRALSLAIDRRGLTKSVYNDQFEPAHSLLPPGMPAYQRLDDLIRFDRTAAEQVIQEVIGDLSPEDRTLEIASGSASDFAKKELALIRKAWQPLGITVKTKFIPDWTRFEQYIASESVQLYRYAWNADLPDPDSFLHPLFSADSPVNFTGFADQKTERMLVEALETYEPIQRAKKYQELERHILQQYPIIPLFYLSIDRVYQSYVQGVHINALGAHTIPLNRVWLKKEPAGTSAD